MGRTSEQEGLPASSRSAWDCGAPKGPDFPLSGRSLALCRVTGRPASELGPGLRTAAPEAASRELSAGFAQGPLNLPGNSAKVMITLLRSY